MNDTPIDLTFHDPEVAAAWASYEKAIQARVALGLISTEATSHLCDSWGMAAWFRSYQAAHIDFKRE